MLPMYGNSFNDRICELLPPFSMVGKRLPGSHGKRRIEEENSLFGPADEAAVGRGLDTEVAGELFIDILKRRGSGNSAPDAEAQPVRLTRAMIRVLADNDNAHRLKRSEFESLKDLAFGREHGMTRPVFLLEKGLELDKIRLAKFFGEGLSPRLWKVKRDE